MVDAKSQALGLLMKDPYRNASVIHIIHTRPDVNVLVEGGSVLAVFTDYEPVTWGYMACADPGEAEALAFRSDMCSGYFLTDASMRSSVALGREPSVNVVCWQYHLPGNVAVPRSDVPVVDLDPAFAPFIYKNYDYASYVNERYVALRIAAGNALGVLDGGSLAAWILTHDEGTIGMLHVMPEHRRKGYGLALASELIHRLRSQGRLPFAHIHKTNDKSLSLFTKLGFVRNAEICWLGFK